MSKNYRREELIKFSKGSRWHLVFFWARQTDALGDEMSDTARPVSLNRCDMVMSTGFGGDALTNEVQSVSPLRNWPPLRITLQTSSPLTTALNNACQNAGSQISIQIFCWGCLNSDMLSALGNLQHLFLFQNFEDILINFWNQQPNTTQPNTIILFARGVMVA